MLLHLKDHCIETAAKKKRRHVVSALLELDESSEGFSQLAEDLDLLTSFLEISDFRRMRSEWPELSGGSDIGVELMRAAEPGGFVLNVVRTLPAETQ